MHPGNQMVWLGRICLGFISSCKKGSSQARSRRDSSFKSTALLLARSLLFTWFSDGELNKHKLKESVHCTFCRRENGKKGRDETRKRNMGEKEGGEEGREGESAPRN